MVVANALIAHPPAALTGAALRITAPQYHRMIEEGIIPEDATTELLNGWIVRKDRSVVGEDPMGHSPLHSMAVSLLTQILSRVNSAAWHAQIQLPIALTELSEPEPDAALVRGQPRDYRERLPTAADVLCVIEAAHSSLDRDHADKLPAYAGSSIPQYVIVNLLADCVEVYSDPDAATATYRTKVTASRGQNVRLNLGNGALLEVAAAEVLP